MWAIAVAPIPQTIFLHQCNRGGLAPKIDSTQVRNACLLLKGPKCCGLEGSPRCRGGTVVQFAQVWLVAFKSCCLFCPCLAGCSGPMASATQESS